MRGRRRRGSAACHRSSVKFVSTVEAACATDSAANPRNAATATRTASCTHPPQVPGLVKRRTLTYILYPIGIITARTTQKSNGIGIKSGLDAPERAEAPRKCGAEAGYSRVNFTSR